jgi:arsenate reductase (glutaredoxin)
MFTIYHNPRCSKSRETLAILTEHGIQPKVVLYLQTPPSPANIRTLLRALKLPVRAIIRTQEPEYQTLKLANVVLTDKALIEAISQNPKLLERPIVIRDDQAVIGRPPENVLSLIAGH